MMAAMQPNPPCRVCASRYTLFVQDVLGRRTGNKFPQFYCMDCQSFFHTSNYRETEQQKADDYNFLFGYRENHARLQNQLFLEIKARSTWIRSVCEVGHGTGLFMKAAQDYGCSAYGFEVNQHCHEFAVSQLGLDCKLGLFDATHQDHYDLFASIMVFEHLENPRDLFALMRDRLNPDGLIYVSVPFVERRDWPYLWTADRAPASTPPDVFYDNDVHITHFSVEGLRRMGLSLGARSADYFVSLDVVNKSPGSYGGVLFQF